MAARYQHLSPAFLSDAVRKLDGVFVGLGENLEAPLRPVIEAENGMNGHPAVTGSRMLPAAMSATA